MTNAAATVKFRWIRAQIKDKIKKKKIKEADKVDHVRKMMAKVYVHEMDEIRITRS